MKRITALAATALAATLLATGCSDAEVASRNLSRAADQFEITRRIVFFNGITDNYLLTIEGRCSTSADTDAKKIDVTCKQGDAFRKHFLGLSDNVSYFVEQIDDAHVSTDHYRVIFKPEVVIPDIDRP